MNNNTSRFASHNDQPNEQQELFSYLTKSQRQKMAEVLRPLKPLCQAELCRRMLRYLEEGHLFMDDGNLVINGLTIFVPKMLWPEK